MSFVNWLLDSFAPEDVIDLFFVMSDLVDINLTEAEICESACFDSLANAAVREYNGEKIIPIGKQVF